MGKAQEEGGRRVLFARVAREVCAYMYIRQRASEPSRVAVHRFAMPAAL
jgi:hypothetical protein